MTELCIQHYCRFFPPFKQLFPLGGVEFIIYDVRIDIHFSVPWGQGFYMNVNSSGVITKVCVCLCVCVCVCVCLCVYACVCVHLFLYVYLQCYPCFAKWFYISGRKNNLAVLEPITPDRCCLLIINTILCDALWVGVLGGEHIYLRSTQSNSEWFWGPGKFWHSNQNKLNILLK